MRAWLNRRFTAVVAWLARDLIAEAEKRGQRTAVEAVEKRIGRIRHIQARHLIPAEEVAKVHLYGQGLLEQAKANLAYDIRSQIKVRFNIDDVLGSHDKCLTGRVTIIDNDQRTT